MILRLTTEQGELLAELGKTGSISLPLTPAPEGETITRRRAAAENLRSAGLLRRADLREAGLLRREYVLTGDGIVALRRRGESLGAWTGADPA